MAARQGMKDMRNNAAGEHQQHPRKHLTMIIVHITEEHPLFSIVTSAHFTTDLKIMSWNKAYAPFFHETFVQHKMYLLGGLTNASGAVSRTYDKLGWSTTDMVIMSDESEVPAFQDLRTGHIFPATNLLGRSHSVVNVSSVTFDDMEVPDAVPDSVLESCRFGFEQRYRSSGKCMEANIAAFNHPLLKYDYTRLPHSDWDFVVSRLETLLPFELAKLDPATRPGNVLKELIDGDLVMSSPLTAWKWTPTTTPEGWNFMDHLVRGWLMMAYQIRMSALHQYQ